MKRILAMAGKEFKQFRRDRLTVVLALALPSVMMTLYGTALTANVRNLPLAFEDLDNTPLSRKYLDAWVATGKFALVRGEDVIRTGVAKAVVAIPPGFERDYLRGVAPRVQVVVDGTDTNTAVLMRNIGAAVAASFQPAPVPAVMLQVRHWYNPGLSDAKYFGTGSLAMVLVLFPALLGAIAVARELELGTVAQAYASTLTAPEWVIGKATPYFLIGLAQFALLFVYGVFLFGYQAPSNPGPLLVGTCLYLAGAVLFGMMVGNITGSQPAAIQAVQLGAFLVSMLLSGFIVSTASMPRELQWVSMMIPARHYVELVRDSLLRDGGWQSTAGQMVWMSGLSLGFFLVNVGRMRRMQF